MDAFTGVPKAFRDFARAPDRADIVDASLIVESAFFPNLDPDDIRAQLDAIGDAFVEHVEDIGDPGNRFQRLGTFLGRDAGFRGDPSSFTDSDSAFLHRVLETRRGLPITLAVIYIATGRRCGLGLDGVALPGRFLVGLFKTTPPRFIDPFRAGHLIATEDCDRIVRQVSGGQVESAAPYLRPARTQAVISRMLRNLQMIYWDREDDERGLLAARLLCVLNPGQGEPFRARAYFYDRMDEAQAAIIDYEAYLRRQPNAPDQARIRHRIRQLRGTLAEGDDH